jgi:hypothetical protein
MLRPVDEARRGTVARPRLRGVDVTSSHPKVFMLSDADRKLVHSGPALVGPDGSQHEVPP